jgi:pilus assembly protein CpaB
MGKLRALVPIALSLIIAIAGTVFLYKWIERQRGPKEIVKVEKMDAAPIVVSAGNLPWGTKLKPEMIKTAPYLKESLPVGYFSSTTDLKDRVLIAPLKLNEPITEAKLAPTSVKTGGVSAVLKPGMRAIAVKGDKIIGISGFINPGNRVDVIVTVEEPKTKKIKSKIFLENMAVLATGTQIEKNEKGEPMPVDVYTLEVTPEQAEKVALAASEGRLQFALRGVTDSEDLLTKGVTVPELLAYQRWSERQKILPKNPVDSNKRISRKHVIRKTSKKKKRWVPRGSVTVEIIKGTKIKKKKVTL